MNRKQMTWAAAAALLGAGGSLRDQSKELADSQAEVLKFEKAGNREQAKQARMTALLLLIIDSWVGDDFFKVLNSVREQSPALQAEGFPDAPELIDALEFLFKQARRFSEAQPKGDG